MSLPTPNTRKEQYLNAIATGNTGGLPTPITREEEYLDAIAKSGGGSGDGDMKKSVYDSDSAVANAGGIGAFVSDAISGKVDKVEGKGLSTNDYDNTEKGKVTANAEAIEATQDMISDAYDSTHTYNVGDYCIHENVLYRCNTASTTGTWDSSKWDALTVTGDITKLLSMFNTGAFNQFRYLGTIQGTAYNKAFEDIVAICYPDTYYDTQTFMGVHAASGFRFVVGYMYADKSYGCCLEISFVSISATYLNDGTFNRVQIAGT